ncbi:MAG: hypothetical protein ABSH07_04090 [Candidatus Dormibacteria bacterium]|jgi:hypothetical protein
MTTHQVGLHPQNRVAAGYGTASRRAIALAVTAIAGLGVLVVWGLSALVG